MNNNFKDEESKIKKEAEEAIKLAYASSKGYESFIRLLPMKRNIGSKTAPHFVETVMPYMTVAGRLKMMVDEHILHKAKYEIKAAQFIYAPDAKTLLCRVEVHTMRGVVTAHAKVGIGGFGIDASNPYENAETSALGRALGFLGYGVLGTGIASFEEVFAATTAAKLEPEHSSSKIDASLKAKIKLALTKRGYSEIEAISYINTLQTRDEAIEFLINLGKKDEVSETEKASESKNADPSTPEPNVAEENAEPTPPPANMKVKTRDLIEFKNLLVKKIGEQEARKVLSKIKHQADLEAMKEEYAL